VISRILVLALALVAAMATGAAAETSASAERAKPAVVLLSDSPVALRGRGFASRERLTVRVSIANRTYTKRLRASAAGTFTARFSEAAARACEPIGVSVTGRGGSRVGLARKIQIPPACGIVIQD
jgi:hypothetical protein